MKLLKLLVLPLFFCGVQSPLAIAQAESVPSATLSAELAAEKVAIETVLRNQEAAWNLGDIEAFMSGYWRSKELRFASGEQITHGWDETFARYQKRYSDRKKMGQLQFDILSVKQFTDSDALVFGRWTLKREQDELTGLFTLTFKKLNGRWLITEDHTSSK